MHYPVPPAGTHTPTGTRYCTFVLFPHSSEPPRPRCVAVWDRSDAIGKCRECVRVVMCPIDSENASGSVDLAHFDPKAVALQVGWRCIHFHFLDFYTHNPHHLILNSVTDPIVVEGSYGRSGAR